MNKVNIHRKVSYSISSKDHGEIHVNHEPNEHLDIHVERVGDKLVVGYLTDDPWPQHPLDDMDGNGRVIGRGKYETRNHSESEMFEALGLDNDGNPNLELDTITEPVIEQWREFVEAIPHEKLHSIAAAAGFEFDAEAEPDRAKEAVYSFRDELGEVDIIRESEFKYAVLAALQYTKDVRSQSYYNTQYTSPIYEAVDESELEFDAYQRSLTIWQQLRDSGKIGDPDAVMLDVYDHSGLHWSVSGGGMRCRWDTSTGAGVWVPDDACRQYLGEIQKVFAFYLVRETPVPLRGGDKDFQLLRVEWGNVDEEPKLAHMEFSDDWYILYKKAKEYSSNLTAWQHQLDWGREQARDIVVQRALDQYNAYIMGACYEPVVEVCSLQTEDDDDPNWFPDSEGDRLGSYYGWDDAEKYLKIEFDAVVNRLTNQLKEIA